jgi:hypothetical protein
MSTNRSKYGELVTEVRDNFQAGSKFWAHTREEGRKDMAAVAGDPWDPKDRAAREDAGRPVITCDEFSQYLNQLINGVRQHPRSIKVTPRGMGANDQTAELRGNKIREIEYRSHAQEAYTTLLENAAQRSFGFMEIKTEWESHQSFLKEILIEPMVNPDQVTIDPFSLRADTSDKEWAFVHEARRKPDFIRKYGKDAQIADFGAMDGAEKMWAPTEDTVQVAAYWKRKTRPRKLLLVQPNGPQPSGIFGLNQQSAPKPISVFEDQFLERGIVGTVVKFRDVEYPSICQYVTNGMEILKETDFPGLYIPIVGCYGKVLYLDDGGGMKRHILSMIRLARDPYMLYCYYRTQQAEMAGMIPKVPVVGYKGQFQGMETDWQRAPHEPLAFIEANAKTEATGEQILPLPTRLAYSAGEHLQSLELCAEGARRAIQAAIGSSPLPTQAQRRNEKSGKALQIIDDAQQLGSFHFIDHFDDALAFGGKIINGIMADVYDSIREIGIRKADGQSEVITINDPSSKVDGYEPTDLMMAEHGEHEVTISTGPNFDSERERADDFTESLVKSNVVLQIAGPEVAAAVLAKSIKLMNLGVIGDEIADLIMPAKFKKDAKTPDPNALMQQIQEADQMLQMAQAKIQELEQQIATDAAKEAEETKRTEMELQGKKQIEAIKLELQPLLEELKGQNARALQELKGAQELVLQNDQQKHEVALAAAQAHQAEKIAERGHEQAEESAEAGHERTLEQQDRAAEASE